jgi:uncharacterized Ntn-hydrolase superfamily protein
MLSYIGSVTYSIVARDASTGDMGVAVQSHFLTVGRHVPWGRSGVGVVATQATANPRYGSAGLARMAAGDTAAAALDACLRADDAAQTRQVGMLDAAGATAAHTGSRCWQFAAHQAERDVSAQANMVAGTDIPGAMVAAFRAASGDLADRLLTALDAAQARGGDLRGVQSAAILVVSGARTPQPEDGVLLDIRVDDHHSPLTELRRISRLHRAFGPMLTAMRGPACRGPVPATSAEVEAALAAFSRAQQVYGPQNLEPTFWRAVALARAGRSGESDALVASLAAGNPGWAVLFRHVSTPAWTAVRAVG